MIRQLLLVFGIAILGVIILGCTPEQSQNATTPQSPIQLSAATTQKLENIQQGVDKIAEKGQAVGTEVQQLGNTGTALGIPYAGWGTIAGGLIISLTGLWLKQRGQTTDATNAAVTIATAANNETPVGLTPALSTAMQTVKSIAPDVHSAITDAIGTTVIPKTS